MRNLLLLFSFRFTLLAEGKPDGEWSWINSSRFGEVKAKAVMKSEDGKMIRGAFWLSESRKLEIESGTGEGGGERRQDGGELDTEVDCRSQSELVLVADLSLALFTRVQA